MTEDAKAAKLAELMETFGLDPKSSGIPAPFLFELEAMVKCRGKTKLVTWADCLEELRGRSSFQDDVLNMRSRMLIDLIEKLLEAKFGEDHDLSLAFILEIITFQDRFDDLGSLFLEASRSSYGPVLRSMVHAFTAFLPDVKWHLESCQFTKVMVRQSDSSNAVFSPKAQDYTILLMTDLIKVLSSGVDKNFGIPTAARVQDLAHALKDALGWKLSKSYEFLAQVAGYRDWNTFSAQLQAKA